MGIFDRMAKGWEISMSCYKVLLSNKQLILFPVLSGFSMLVVLASFVVALFAGNGWDADMALSISPAAGYLLLFLMYVVNYFVIVYFNMALMHCARLYFEGEEVSISRGLQFSNCRLGAIFSWAMLAATVGFVLRIIQENAGWLGKIVISIVGFVWSLSTFFVIPVLAYEDLGPVEAAKRSALIMKEKWGESLGASFSLSLFPLLCFLCMGAISFGVTYFINEGAGIALFVVSLLGIFAVSSALNSIFISAAYSNINGDINQHINKQLLDGLFVEKSK